MDCSKDNGNDNKQASSPRIKPLAKQVVDRIAAGEVVQRPASIAKELIENSLDADAITIDIHCTGGGLSFLSITDDGNGFHPNDLPLAAARFATSKLVHFDDLNLIKTFGFRGEALASASMVGRLTIISRKRHQRTIAQGQNKNDNQKKNNDCAYKLSYIDGQPKGKPLPSAGKYGTQVKIEDLFYNMQSRRRAFEGTKKENEEYLKILNVAQRYAVHCSKDGVGFVCRKRGGVTDLNTAGLTTLKKLQNIRKGQSVNNSSSLDEKKLSETAMKETIGHLFGSELTRELLVLESSEGDIGAVEARKNTISSSETQILSPELLRKVIEVEKENGSDHIFSSDTFAYKAYGLCTNGSYCGSKSCSVFILFINDRLVESGPIRRAVEGIYVDILPRGVKPFVYLSIKLPGLQIDVNVHPTKREVAILHEDRLCSALANAVTQLLRSTKTSKTFYAQALLPIATEKVVSRKRKANNLPSSEEDKRNDKPRSRHENFLNKKEVHAKNLVRTTAAAEQKLLEPFLSPTAKTSCNSRTDSKDSSKSPRQKESGLFEHQSDCVFAVNRQKVDLSKPGAFASICRCQIERPGFSLSSQPSYQTVVRPKKIDETECDYTSIATLRKDVRTRAHRELTTKLRGSIFVGCVSRHRSLLQSGIELLIINHIVLARELFYQLSLLQFGGFRQIASLGNDGVDVGILLEKALQFEDGINSNPNDLMAGQITECLASNAEMLLEYFSIRFELKRSSSNANDKRLMLTGLPVILKGHSPSPHALPMFLLRLATQVNWMEEKSCFDGICTELSYYYAEIPEGQKETESIQLNENEKKIVQHVLFPAFRYYLVPPVEFASDGSFSKLALLSKLYKVFERC